MQKTYLRRVFTDQTITLDATDGTETFASSGFFTGGVHGLSLPAGGKPTFVTNVKIYEQTVAGKWSTIFESLGKTRNRWKNQSQVLRYCRDHTDKLRADEYGTAFELEGGLIAFVEKGYAGPDVMVHKLNDGWMIWPAEYRIRYAVLQNIIRKGMGALIRGGTFTVMGKSEKKGFWCLTMETKMIRRKRDYILIEIPESEVLEGIQAYQTEEVAKSCARESSVFKDVYRTRFLPRKMDVDDPNERPPDKHR